MRSATLFYIKLNSSAHPGGESDTTIIVAKALASAVQNEFPQVKLGHYHALEGRNDLQSGLTILASAVPINLPAIQREAQALWPGIDITLTRRNIAFEYANAEGELLATEQIDAVDKRLSSLIAQHRDAAAIQGVHRSRIIRQSGRSIVVMFARPIPGLRPTNMVIDRPTSNDKRAQRKAATLGRLTESAQELIADGGGFAANLLAAAAGVDVKTARKYIPEICKELALNRLTVPVLQPLANETTVRREIEIVLSPKIAKNIEMHVREQRYNSNLITTFPHVHLDVFLPESWKLDVDTLIARLKPVASEPTERPTPATAIQGGAQDESESTPLTPESVPDELRSYFFRTLHDCELESIRMQAANHGLAMEFVPVWGGWRIDQGEHVPSRNRKGGRR